MTEYVVEAKGLGKTFGDFHALKHVDFKMPIGRIIGVIGANGAGKTTLLNAVLGLTTYEGDLKVLGHNPATERDALMKDVCFIADIATLPKWMKVSEVLDFVEEVHPRFDRKKAMTFLDRTNVPQNRKVRALSKGMTVQLHLAVVMSIEAKLLVLDEPTEGIQPSIIKDIARVISMLRDKGGMAILLVEQYFEFARDLADQFAVMDRGEVVMHGRQKNFSLGA